MISNHDCLFKEACQQNTDFARNIFLNDASNKSQFPTRGDNYYLKVKTLRYKKIVDFELHKAEKKL